MKQKRIRLTGIMMIVGEMIMRTKMVKLTMESIWRVKIDQHRTWTRLAASVKKGRGPRRIEVQ